MVAFFYLMRARQQINLLSVVPDFDMGPREKTLLLQPGVYNLFSGIHTHQNNNLC